MRASIFDVVNPATCLKQERAASPVVVIRGNTNGANAFSLAQQFLLAGVHPIVEAGLEKNRRAISPLALPFPAPSGAGRQHLRRLHLCWPVVRWQLGQSGKEEMSCSTANPTSCKLFSFFHISNFGPISDFTPV